MGIGRPATPADIPPDGDSGAESPGREPKCRGTGRSGGFFQGFRRWERAGRGREAYRIALAL